MAAKGLLQGHAPYSRGRVDLTPVCCDRIAPKRGHSHRDLPCSSPGSSPTTRNCILPINAALWASVARIAAKVSFEVVVVEPNKTTPPTIAAIALMTAAGTNGIAPRSVAKVQTNPPIMAIFEICEIRRDLAIASARSSMRSSSRKISSRGSQSATHSSPASDRSTGGSSGNVTDPPAKAGGFPSRSP